MPRREKRMPRGWSVVGPVVGKEEEGGGEEVGKVS